MGFQSNFRSHGHSASTILCYPDMGRANPANRPARNHDHARSTKRERIGSFRYYSRNFPEPGLCGEFANVRLGGARAITGSAFSKRGGHALQQSNVINPAAQRIEILFQPADLRYSNAEEGPARCERLACRVEQVERVAGVVERIVDGHQVVGSPWDVNAVKCVELNAVGEARPVLGNGCEPGTGSEIGGASATVEALHGSRHRGSQREQMAIIGLRDPLDRFERFRGESPYEIIFASAESCHDTGHHEHLRQGPPNKAGGEGGRILIHQNCEVLTRDSRVLESG